MIAADTSTWIAFLEGEDAPDSRLLDRALAGNQLLMPPAVLTELLSDPELPSSVARTLSALPRIELAPDYWEKAGALRATVLAKNRKARLGDSLIAQSCLDRRVPLLTRDKDFRAFAQFAGLAITLP